MKREREQDQTVMLASKRNLALKIKKVLKTNTPTLPKSFRDCWAVCQVEIISGFNTEPYPKYSVELVTVLPLACPTFILTGWCKVEEDKKNQKLKISLAAKDGQWKFERPQRITREDVTWMVRELGLNMNNKQEKGLRDKLYTLVDNKTGSCSVREIEIIDEFKDMEMDYKCDFFWAELQKPIRDAFGKKWQKKFDGKNFKEVHTKLMKTPWYFCFEKYTRPYGLKEMSQEKFNQFITKYRKGLNLNPMIRIALRIYDYIRRRYQKQGIELINIDKLFLEYMCDPRYSESAVKCGHEQFKDPALDFLKIHALDHVHDNIYTLPKTKEVNEALVHRIAALNITEGSPETRDGRVPCIPSSTLTEEQQRFIKHVHRNKVSFLEGPPGTGKTEVLVALFAEFKNILVVTYVGMMVDALQNRLGKREEPTAHTIHYICCQHEYVKESYEWLLKYDVIVIDEGSNVDANLMKRLLKSTLNIAKLVIVGDLGQIFPIKAGSPFMDLVKTFPQHSFRLNENKRVDSDSKFLAEAASLIREGKSRDVVFNEHPCLGFIVLEPDPTARVQEQIFPPVNSKDGVNASQSVLSDLIFNHFHVKVAEDTMNFQIVTLRNKDREALNIMTENLLLERGILKKRNAVKFKDIEIYPGLKIQFTKNKKTANVRNGEIGQVKSIVKHRGGDYILTLTNNKTVGISYSNEEFVQPWELILGYGGTSNKVQGSQWHNIIFWIYSNPKSHFTREYPYVAISRAQKKCIVVADRIDDFHHICKYRAQEKQTLFRYYLQNLSLPKIHEMVDYEDVELKDPSELQLLSKEIPCVPRLSDVFDKKKKKTTKKGSTFAGVGATKEWE